MIGERDGGEYDHHCPPGPDDDSLDDRVEELVAWAGNRIAWCEKQCADNPSLAATNMYGWWMGEKRALLTALRLLGRERVRS